YAVYMHSSALPIARFLLRRSAALRDLYSFPTRRSSDLYATNFEVFLDTLVSLEDIRKTGGTLYSEEADLVLSIVGDSSKLLHPRSEEHTSELQSRENLVCRLLLEKKK